MDILVPTLIVFGGVTLIMSIGILFKRKPIQGTCGGIANLTGDCDICDLREKCIELNAPQCDEHRNHP